MEQEGSKSGSMEYTETIMMGSHVQKELINFVRSSQRFRSMRMGDKKVKSTLDPKKPTSRLQQLASLSTCPGARLRLRWGWNWVLRVLGVDWLFILTLGVVVACLSYFMDYCIFRLQQANLMMYDQLREYPVLQYIVWVVYPLALITFSIGFSHLVGPSAVGSGIPEMKTILRGVNLRDYLSFRTLVSKVIGLIFSVGSGLPIGKEGPFIHIASLVAANFSRMVTGFNALNKNNEVYLDILSAACAIGVACHFAAPIGGLLFSIEVTATHFAVRNYWRGFFGAVVGTTTFLVIGMWDANTRSLTALFVTDFPIDLPYDPIELLFFALLGVGAGLIGAAFTWLHRLVVTSLRRKRVHHLLSHSRFIYPILVVVTIGTLTFPPWLGKYMAADLSGKQQVNQLFSNFAWSTGVHTLEQQEVIKHWTAGDGSVFLVLTCYFLSKFIFTPFSIAMPVAYGIFVPTLQIGAGYGRLVGEALNLWLPTGLDGIPIFPGAYSMAAAAAVTGSVTHTVSTAVIMFELSGQLQHAIPILVCTLLSNVVSQMIQPSLFDSIIQMKNLPFLPDITAAKTRFFELMAEDILETKFKMISHSSTYKEAYRTIKDLPPNDVVPVVESEESLVLIGCVRVGVLRHKINQHIGKRKQQEFCDSGKNWEELKMRTVGYLGPGSIRSENPSRPLSIVSLNDKESTLPKIPKAKVSKVKPIQNNFSGTLTLLASPETTIQQNEGKKWRSELAKSTKSLTRPMTEKEIAEWEELRMKMSVQLSLGELDTSPFAVNGTTSLPKLYTLYSLLGLKTVYVTILGKLIGVISIEQFRKAMRHPELFAPVIMPPEYYGGPAHALNPPPPTPPASANGSPGIEYNPDMLESTNEQGRGGGTSELASEPEGSHDSSHKSPREQTPASFGSRFTATKVPHP